jgi:hypothetical protein
MKTSSTSPKSQHILFSTPRKLIKTEDENLWSNQYSAD